MFKSIIALVILVTSLTVLVPSAPAQYWDRNDNWDRRDNFGPRYSGRNSGFGFNSGAYSEGRSQGWVAGRRDARQRAWGATIAPYNVGRRFMAGWQDGYRAGFRSARYGWRY
jgi:hypothetical protein